MNAKLLVVAVLFTAPLMALSEEAAEARLNAAHANLEAAREAVDGHKKHLDGLQTKMRGFEGRAEFGQTIEAHNGAHRQKIEEHNRACEKLAIAVKELDAALKHVGTYHNITHSEGRYHVTRAERNMEPVVVGSPEGAVATYRSTRTLRGRMA